MLVIDQETAEDFEQVEALLDLAFAPGRQALSSYRLRQDISALTDLSLVARENDLVGGVIRYWPVMAGNKASLLLGPIAVHPTRQGEGLGSILINDSLARARALNWERVILIGDEIYYSKFGFSKKIVMNLEFPSPTNPERFLGLELTDNAFDDVSGMVTKWML